MNIEGKESFFEKKLWLILLVLGLIAFGLYFYKFNNGFQGLSGSTSEWDHFGSYIGGIFSGMAFLALIAEMRANKKREEEQESRYQKQINKLKNEKKEQDKRWKKEDFERTFFMMLSQFNEKLSFLNNSDINDIYNSIVLDSFSYFETIRNKTENEKYSDINMLFINLYRTLKFIDESHFEINNKKLYTGILRSYLSRKFLVILGFHLLYRDSSYNKYIEYINKYNIFEHIGLKYLEIKVLKKNLSLQNPLGSNLDEGYYKTIIEYILMGKDRCNTMLDVDNLTITLNTQSKERLNEFIQARIKGMNFQFSRSIDETNYDFIFMHLITNFKPEAFANSLEYRDTTTIYNSYISELKKTYSKKLGEIIYAKTTFGDQYTRS